MSACILQAPGGDWAVDSNGRLTVELDPLIVAGHKLRNRFKLFEGTWFLDLTIGFPYYRYVLGQKNPDLVFLRRLFSRLILGVSPTIDTIERLDLSHDTKARKLNVYFYARSVDGRVLEGGPGLPFRINGEDI